MSNFKFGIRNQCIFLAIYSAVILLFASTMSHGGRSSTETRYVCQVVPPVKPKECRRFSAAEAMCTGTRVNRLDAKAVQSRE